MGLFISVSGIIDADIPDVAGALAKHVARKHGIFEAQVRSPEDDDTLVLCRAHGNTSLFFPVNDLSWWETSQALSRLLQKAVFAFHIHDSDLWMYELYRNGEKIDAFNPIPDYWMEISDAERAGYRGNARAVASCVPKLEARDVTKYLATWNLDAKKQEKAYPSDEFPHGNEWQLLDFMKKLGLPYPLDKEGRPLGPTYEFIIPSPKSEL